MKYELVHGRNRPRMSWHPHENGNTYVIELQSHQLINIEYVKSVIDSINSFSIQNKSGYP